MAPAIINTKASPIRSFRGSFTRLHGSLSTLEGALSGHRPRLASGGRSRLAGRVSHPRGLDRDFPLLSGCLFLFSFLFLFRFSAFPVSPGFGWRHLIETGERPSPGAASFEGTDARPSSEKASWRYVRCCGRGRPLSGSATFNHALSRITQTAVSDGLYGVPAIDQFRSPSRPGLRSANR